MWFIGALRRKLQKSLSWVRGTEGKAGSEKEDTRDSHEVEIL